MFDAVPPGVLSDRMGAFLGDTSADGMETSSSHKADRRSTAASSVSHLPRIATVPAHQSQHIGR